MAVYTPNLQLVRYKGETPRKLWEIKARSIPTLSKGDLVLLDATTAVLMVKKYGFEMVENSKLVFSESFAGESQDDEVLDGQIQASKTSVVVNSIKNALGFNDSKAAEYKLPLASNIMALSDDEIKEACKYVGVSLSNKKVETLRELLLPYLPKE